MVALFRTALFYLRQCSGKGDALMHLRLGERDDQITARDSNLHKGATTAAYLSPSLSNIELRITFTRVS